MAKDGKGGDGDTGGADDFMPTTTLTASPGQQEAFDTHFANLNALDPSMGNVGNQNYLTQAGDIYQNILSGGYRDALQNAALEQTINPINSAAMQAGRYGSMPQQQSQG